MLLEGCSLRPEVACEELGGALFTWPFIRLQTEQRSQTLFTETFHGLPLTSYVHSTARRAIQADQLPFLAEKRAVVTCFAMVMGLEAPLLAGLEGLGAVQQCFESTLRCVEDHGGELRQFIVDDKGVVMIWTFGLPKASYEDNCRRGLSSSFAVVERLKGQGLSTKVGVTSGGAFCGRVGGETRCEYGVMGPSVNLAARLMSRAAVTDDVAILCDETVVSELRRLGDSSFLVSTSVPMTFKGYDQPVTIYQPEQGGNLSVSDSFEALRETTLARANGKRAEQSPGSRSQSGGGAGRTISDVVLMKMDR